jgi:hypothetical protein
MRDSIGEVACLDSQPHLPPCDSALMRVAAYGFVFIYENPFPGKRVVFPSGFSVVCETKMRPWNVSKV